MCIQMRALRLGVSPMGRTSFRRLLWPLAAALDGWQVCAGRRVHFRNRARLWHRKVFSIPLQKSAAIPLPCPGADEKSEISILAPTWTRPTCCSPLCSEGCR